MTSREIAQKLFISERTAEGHVQQIRSKLGFRSRVELAAWVARSESIAATVAPTPVGTAQAAAHVSTRVRPVWLTSRTLLAAGSAFALLAAIILVLDTVVPRLGTSAVVQPIHTIAGTGNAFISDDGKLPSKTDLVGPSGVVVGGDGSVYFTEGNRIRKVGPLGLVVTIAGNGGGGSMDGDSALTADLRMGFNGTGDIYATPEFEGFAIDSNGGVVFPEPISDRIRRISPDGKLQTIAGDGAPAGHVFIPGFQVKFGDGGPASASVLTFPRGCAFDDQGSLYIADTIDNRIRRVDHSTGVITTVAGTGTPGSSGDNGPADKAELNAPQAVVVARDGTLYIADTGNQRIRRVKDGVITSVAGTGLEGYAGDGGAGIKAELDVPLGLATDSHGSLYIADSGNDRVRKLDATGLITTVAGNGLRGYAGDGGPAASSELAQPVAVAVDASNNLYIVDSLNNRIRVVVL